MISKHLRQMDQKIQNSFHYVQNDLITLENRQYDILRRLERIERAFLQSSGVLKAYIGDKRTREVHDVHCVLADEIIATNKISFQSLREARSFGFQTCICLE